MEKKLLVSHIMRSHESYETTAQILVKLVHEAATNHPGKPRVLVLDVEGHRNGEGGFDRDAYELMTYFILEVLSPFLTAFQHPLGSFRTTKPQSDETFERIEFGSEEELRARMGDDASIVIHQAGSGAIR